MIPRGATYLGHLTQIGWVTIADAGGPNTNFFGSYASRSILIDINVYFDFVEFNLQIVLKGAVCTPRNSSIQYFLSEIYVCCELGVLKDISFLL